MATVETGIGQLRVVTFNVNGLRAALKRKFGTVTRLLEEVNADILCIQETKLRRSELERSLALVDGWDSFFAFAQSAKGYSGVATFAKTSLALPHAAEEGFTGCCAAPSQASNGISVHPALAERFTVEELQELDSEGRVVITDHGAFVLFNVYGPALTSEDTLEQRMAFKLQFYKALQCRWEDCLSRGRAVLVVGDLNICPAPLDSCDPEPNFHRPTRPDRLWLHSLLQPQPSLDRGPGTLARPTAPAALSNGWVDEQLVADGAIDHGISGGKAAYTLRAVGWFVDVFRAFHPGRKDAYTCWNTATSARSNNYGARIDVVLAAGLHVSNASAEHSHNHHHHTLAHHDQQESYQENQNAHHHHTHNQQHLHDGEASVHERHQRHSSHQHNMMQQQQQQQQCGELLHGPRNQAGPFDQSAVWLSGCDIMPEVEGSDHAPVWVEVSFHGRFPCAAEVPLTGTRHVFSGKQLKLHGWLSMARGPAQQEYDMSATPSQQGGEEVSTACMLCSEGNDMAADVAAELAGTAGPAPELSAFSPGAAVSRNAQQAQRRGSGGTSMRGRGAKSAASGKKQASLKGFFLQPPASSTQQAQQDLWDGAPGNHSCAVPCNNFGTAGVAAADVAGAMQDSKQLPHESGQAASTRAVLAVTAADVAPSVDQGAEADATLRPRAADVACLVVSQGEAMVSTAAAADAWRQIQQRMAVPRCQHGEEAVLKRVNKSGPNHGRYFYVCRRPDGPKPEGQCGFFQWVKKRPGDFAGSGRAAGNLARAAGGGKRSKGPL